VQAILAVGNPATALYFGDAAIRHGSPGLRYGNCPIFRKELRP
jgi:hypothetical protein